MLNPIYRIINVFYIESMVSSLATHQFDITVFASRRRYWWRYYVMMSNELIREANKRICSPDDHTLCASPYNFKITLKHFDLLIFLSFKAFYCYIK